MGFTKMLSLWLLTLCVTDYFEHGQASVILPKLTLTSDGDDDSCQNRTFLVLHDGKVKLSYEGAATVSTCSWKIPHISQSKFSVIAYKVNKFDLKNEAGCVGHLKFPGRGYRCALSKGDCFIYTTKENSCDTIDILRAIKSELQCTEAVMNQASLEEMSTLFFDSSKEAGFKISFDITASFHKSTCDETKISPTPENMMDNDENKSEDPPNNATIADFDYVKSDSGNIFGSSQLLKYALMIGLPVLLVIIGVIAIILRSKRRKQPPSHHQSQETILESNVSRDIELNEYDHAEIIVEYQTNPRHSFISFPDSENQSAVVVNAYKLTDGIAESNGYLVPMKDEPRYTAPAEDKHTRTVADNNDEPFQEEDNLGYFVPPENDEEDTASIYNDDPFVDDENPYEIVREVYYRSESYSED